MSSSKAEPETRSWVQEANLGGDFQEAGERDERNEQRQEKQPRKMASVGNWYSTLAGPEAGALIHCSLIVEGFPGAGGGYLPLPPMEREKQKETLCKHEVGATIIVRNVHLG